MGIYITDMAFVSNEWVNDEQLSTIGLDNNITLSIVSPLHDSYQVLPDIETNIKSVQKRPNIPIGENIRDAIRSLKGENMA